MAASQPSGTACAEKDFRQWLESQGGTPAEWSSCGLARMAPNAAQGELQSNNRVTRRVTPALVVKLDQTLGPAQIRRALSCPAKHRIMGNGPVDPNACDVSPNDRQIIIGKYCAQLQCSLSWRSTSLRRCDGSVTLSAPSSGRELVAEHWLTTL